MRTLILAVFAVLTLAVAIILAHGDTMMILLGITSAIGGARLAAPIQALDLPEADDGAVRRGDRAVRARRSRAPARLLARRPTRNTRSRRYLPLATAVFVIVLTLIYRFGFVRADDDDRRSLLRGEDADHLPAAVPAAHHDEAKSLCPRVRRLPDPDQPVPGRARRAPQLLPERFRQRDPGRPTTPIGSSSGISCLFVFTPLGDHHHRLRRDRIFHRRQFRLQWRRWMTASYTSRWLLNSMHYKLALAVRQRRQPRPAYFAGHRRLHQRQRHRLEFRQRRHLQLHDPAHRLGDQPRLVLDHPVGHFARA